VLAVGAAELKDANDGNANAAGTCSCALNNTRTVSMPVNKRRVAERNRLKVITPANADFDCAANGAKGPQSAIRKGMNNVLFIIRSLRQSLFAISNCVVTRATTEVRST
jgi:hypothetical protein